MHKMEINSPIIDSSVGADLGTHHELKHLPILDGWRALSIILVMLGHLFPMGPNKWALNGTVAATGMVIFFNLSGFLITRFIIEDGNIRRFIIRRFLRIIPLAWVGMLLAFFVSGGASFEQVTGNLLFYMNLPPFFGVKAGSHFWSLCVEMQFYLSIALLVAIGKRISLFIIPIICMSITIIRIVFHEPVSIVTWFRIDEILAGSTLALIYEGWLGEKIKKIIAAPNFIFLFLVVIISSDERTIIAYFRPYISALMIGTSLYNCPKWIFLICRWRLVVYVARISYALYVFHDIYVHSWLGSGDKIVKYAKRPLLVMATFICAHISTFYYEKNWNSLAHRLTNSQ